MPEALAVKQDFISLTLQAENRSLRKMHVVSKQGTQPELQTEAEITVVFYACVINALTVKTVCLL